MDQRRLYHELDRIVARFHKVRRRKQLACGWFVLLCVGLVAYAAPSAPGFERSTLATGVLLAAGGWWILARWLNRTQSGDHRQAARAIEDAYPELNDRLLAAMEQNPSAETGRFGFLQQQLLREVVDHSRIRGWTETVPSAKLSRISWFNALLACLLLATVSVLYTTTVDQRSLTTDDGKQAWAPGDMFRVTIEPGDTEIERGQSLLVLARFPEAVPAEALLVIEADPEVSTETAIDPEMTAGRIALTRSLEDPVFGGRIPSVAQGLIYHVEFEDRRTRRFRVNVFDYPKLDRADATVSAPEYTRLDKVTLADTRSLSVVEGSTVELTCFVNKELQSAALVTDDDTRIAMLNVNGQPDVFRVTLRPQAEREVYRVILTDADGRRNREEDEITIHVLPNLPPELKLAFPARDIQTSPLEEVPLEATVWDDFGVKQHGVVVTVAGRDPETIVINEDAPAKAETPLSHLMALETLNVEPDELVSYYFFADDIGPGGELRRTRSDMFFAEVRHFEEIFRQGQQPPPGGGQQQGGSQNAQQAEELAKLQKEIVNATWKLIRRGTANSEMAEWTADVDALLVAQKAVGTKLEELQQKISDPRSLAAVESAVGHVHESTQKLIVASRDLTDDALQPALPAEQAAYQALLKLRAREHEVVQGQNSGSGKGSGSGRSQQQMQQLELTEKDNRYETQQQASAAQESAGAQEQLQVLNRLRELARRQGDSNQKLKELEAALREATTEQERKEIERQLKKLREEHQELLRDVDELRNRMERPQNQSQMAEARQQLDEARERVQQASEALREGQVSQALNSGTRAERDLNQLRDDFRKKSANQFAETMRNLQDQTHELEERENDLQEALHADVPENGRPKLRREKTQDRVEELVNDQKRQLQSVLEQMREVVLKAEDTEPLLAQQLYDTARQARKYKADQALEAAARLARQGRTSEADQAEQQARQGIDVVRKGIDAAAESILGEQLEALKLARNELQDLSQQVREERNRQPGEQQPGGQQPGGQQPGGQQPGEQQPGEQQPGEQQPGGQQPGEQQPGEQQPGGQQPGGQQPGGQQPGGQQPGGQQPGGQQPGGQQPGGQQPGEQQPGEQQPGGQQPGGQQPGGQQPGGQSSQLAEATNSPSQAGGRGRGGLRGRQPGSANQPSPGQQNQPGSEGGSSGGPGGPLTGSNFQQWSDRLRNVEEMVDSPELRAEVARVRDRARSMRVEFKRHSREPEWGLVQSEILEPLLEIQQRVAEEIVRRDRSDSLVPIDRDPVPERFSKLVREYYQQLGSGR